MTTVSLESEIFSEQKMNYLKLSGNQYQRIHIPDISGILMYNQHYSEEEGAGYIRCLKDKGEPCPICENVNEPVTKFKINVLVYNTNTEDGTEPDDLSMVTMVPKVWKCGLKILSQLKAKHKKVAKKGGLPAIDLILHCTNEQYQHVDIEDCDEALCIKDARLKQLSDKCKTQFVNFETVNDRDLKFPTPMQLQRWLKAVTGQSTEGPKKPVKKDEQQTQSIEEIENLDENPSVSEEDLMKDLGLK